MMPPWLSSLRAFGRARLSREGCLGLQVTAGVLVLLTALAVFAAIAEDVMAAESITRMDAQVAQWFHAHATPLLTQCMLWVTWLHSTPGIIALCLLLAVYWGRTQAWDWLLTLVLAVPLGMLLNVLLKNIFQRARPSFEVPLLTLNTYSFPSGHATAATLFYGVLAAYAISRSSAWLWRVLVAWLAVSLAALVGLSRIYLGVHYVSDVLAGMAEGCGWLAIVLTAVGIVRRRRQRPVVTL